MICEGFRPGSAFGDWSKTNYEHAGIKSPAARGVRGRGAAVLETSSGFHTDFDVVPWFAFGRWRGDDPDQVGVPGTYFLPSAAGRLQGPGVCLF